MAKKTKKPKDPALAGETRKSASEEGHAFPTISYTKDLLQILSVSLIIFLFFSFTGPSRGHLLLDQGYEMTLLEKMMQGNVPYRDFDFLYTPLEYYIHLPFLNLFNSIITLRIINLLFALLGVFGVYLVTIRFVRTNHRFIPPFLYTLFIYPIFNVPEPGVICGALIIFSILFAIKKKHILLGFMLALCFLTKQNIGIYQILAFTAYLLYQKDFSGFLKSCLGMLLIFLPYTGYLVFTGSLSSFIYQVFIFPFMFKDLIVKGDLLGPFLHPAPSLYWMLQLLLRGLYLFPLFVYALCLVPSLKSRKLMALLFASAACFLQFYPNLDLAHFAWGVAPSFILFVFLFKDKRLILYPLVIGYVLLAAYGTVFFQTTPFTNTQPLGLHKAELIFLDPADATLVEDIVEKIGNESIYVLGDEFLFYYLTNQTIPTRVTQLYSGESIPRDTYGQVISDLESARPTYVILNSKKDSSGFGVLSEYIGENYNLETCIEEFCILRRDHTFP